MDKKKIYLTQQRLDELQKELEDLAKVRRPAVVTRVTDARNQGDLSENAEYHAAKEELEFVDGRIDELKEILKQTEIIKGHQSGKNLIELGSTVVLEANNDKDEYMIVGEWEANPMERKISYESPLGKALLGKVTGDQVFVEAPVGNIKYTVISVS